MIAEDQKIAMLKSGGQVISLRALDILDGVQKDAQKHIVVIDGGTGDV